MRHIGQGIGQLVVTQRPPCPIGEPARLVQLDLQHLAHQSIIGDLLAIARRHARYLGIE